MNDAIIVTAIDVSSESFADALIITKEREKEIDTIVERLLEETQTYPDCVAALSKHMDNANELAYACFHLGAYAESQRAKNQLLYKLLGE